MMNKKSIAVIFVMIYMAFAAFLFFDFPESDKSIRTITVWLVGISLTGFMGGFYCTIPVVNIYRALKTRKPSVVLHAIFVSLISLSMAAIIYCLRFFPELISSRLILIFLALLYVIAMTLLKLPFLKAETRK